MAIEGGAATEIEMKEKKAGVEDALHATRAAIEEGVVPGGGVALIRAQKALEKLEGGNEDETVDILIMIRSIEESMRQVIENAGEDAAVVLNAVKAGKGARIGICVGPKLDANARFSGMNRAAPSRCKRLCLGLHSNCGNDGYASVFCKMLV